MRVLDRRSVSGEQQRQARFDQGSWASSSSRWLGGMAGMLIIYRDRCGNQCPPHSPNKTRPGSQSGKPGLKRLLLRTGDSRTRITGTQERAVAVLKDNPPVVTQYSPPIWLKQ